MHAFQIATYSQQAYTVDYLSKFNIMHYESRNCPVIVSCQICIHESHTDRIMQETVLLLTPVCVVKEDETVPFVMSQQTQKRSL